MVMISEAGLCGCHKTAKLATSSTRGLAGCSYLYVGVFDWLQGLKGGGST